MCEAILRASGHPTGMYTSPHLSHYGERFRIGGVAMSPGEFASACERLDAAIPPEAEVPSKSAGDFRTVFEYLTAMALFEFRRARLFCGGVGNRPRRQARLHKHR
jgi:dihydrofolate synthase/folylpolyglutamate synthase